MNITFLLAALSLFVAGTAAAPAYVPDSCVLQKNTEAETLQLAVLAPLFGESLTTESNGNVYYVSICSSVPQTFNGPRKFAGAVKLSAEGHAIELGSIEHSSVRINEVDIVLTYSGGDVDKNPHDSCKGLKWKTYLTFVCVPDSIKDVLILIDEDTDQPEICQIWFEIKTQKICNRKHILLNDLKNHASINNKLIYQKEETEKNVNHFNEIKPNSKPYNIESSKSDSGISGHEISKNESNQTNSHYTESVYEPAIIEKTNFINKKESTNNIQENEPNLNNYSPHNAKMNDAEKVEKINEEFESDISTQIKTEDHSPENESPSGTNQPLVYTNPDLINEKESMNRQEIKPKSDNILSNNEKSYKENNEIINGRTENSNSAQVEAKDHLFENENLSEPNQPVAYIKPDSSNEKESMKKQENKTESNNNLSHYENIYSGKQTEMINEGRENANSNVITTKAYESKNESHSDNQSELNPQFTKLEDESIRKETENSVQTKPLINNKKQSGKSSQSMPIENNESWKKENVENSSNENNTSNSNEHENIVYVHREDTSIKTPLEEGSSNDKYDDFIKNKNYDSTRLMPDNKLTEYKVQSDDKVNSHQNSQLPEDDLKNSEKEKEIKISPEETHANNENIVNFPNKNSKLPEDDLKNSEKEKEIKISPEETHANNENIVNFPNKNSKLPEYDRENSEKEKEIKISREETHSNNDNVINLPSKNTPKHTFSNDEDGSRNKNLEIIRSKKNIYPLNEENNANNLSSKKSYIDELNNSGKSIIPSSDTEKELKPNNSQISSIENEHLKTLDSITNINKPYVNLNPTISQNSYPEESFPKKKIMDSSNIKEQLEIGDQTSINNNNDKIDYSQENYSKSFDLHSTDDDKIITTESTVESPNISQLKTSNDSPNQPNETNIEHIKTSVDEPAITEIANGNQINAFGENTKIEKPTEPSMNQNSQNNSFIEHNSEKLPNIDDKNSTATDSDQSEKGFSFASIYSKLFPNGIQLSPAIILGGLGSLTAVSALIGTAVNRFYHKKTGTDQIPFKGFFVSIFIFIQSFISKAFCGCCGKSEEPDVSNESTPLMNPKAQSAKRKKRNADDSDNSDNGERKKKDGYGSMSDDSQSVKDDASGTISNVFKTKVVPVVENILGKMGINLDKGEKEEKETARFAEKNIESPQSEKKKQKSTNIEEGLEKIKDNVKNETSTGSDLGTTARKPEILNEKENATVDKVEDEPMRKSVDGKLNAEPEKTSALLDENRSTDSADANVQKSVGPKRNFGLKLITAGLLDSARKKSKDKVSENVKDEIRPDPSTLFQFVSAATVNKTNETKQPVSNAVEEEKKENDAPKDDTNANGDDQVEYIEEIQYVDAEDGEDGEEIIEEIIETTTTLDSSDGESGEPSVTVTKTTRKISSSSKPGEVTVEETVVLNNEDNGTKKRKKSFGLKLGIGKAGVNASVGEKKMTVGLSGVKFGKKRDKSDGPDAISVGLDETGLTLNRDQLRPDSAASDASSVSGRSTDSLPRKSKKTKAGGKSNFSLFKRSTSQPTEPDLPEDPGDVQDPKTSPTSKDGGTLPRKTSQGSAGLLVFGKTRAAPKSTGGSPVPDNDIADIVTDLNDLSDFIDQERQSNVQQLGPSPVDDDKIAETPKGRDGPK